MRLRIFTLLVSLTMLSLFPQFDGSAKGSDGWFSWKKVPYAQLGKKVSKAIKEDESLQNGFHLICKRYIVPKEGYTLLKTVNPEMLILFNADADGLGPDMNAYRKWAKKFDDDSMYIARCSCENESSDGSGCSIERDSQMNYDLASCLSTDAACNCVSRTVYINKKGEVQFGY